MSMGPPSPRASVIRAGAWDAATPRYGGAAVSPGVIVRYAKAGGRSGRPEAPFPRNLAAGAELRTSKPNHTVHYSAARRVQLQGPRMPLYRGVFAPASTAVRAETGVTRRLAELVQTPMDGDHRTPAPSRTAASCAWVEALSLILFPADRVRNGAVGSAASQGKNVLCQTRGLPPGATPQMPDPPGKQR